MTVDVSQYIDADRGLIRGEIFHSREIYERELEQVFARSWLFLAHDSMIPKPGDFIGFPAPSVAHLMSNPGPDDLVYLSGGENREFDVAEFPRLGRRLVRSGQRVDVYDEADARSFGPL